MSTPVALPQFTAVQIIEEALTPDSSVTGDPVSVQPLNILVAFTPSITEVEVGGNVPPFTVALDPIKGRVDTDGKLKGINSEPVFYVDGSTINPVPTVSSADLPVHPVWAGGVDPAYWIDEDGNQVANPAGTPQYGVRLVSNSSLLALANPLTYRVDYSHGDVLIASFRFAAPTTDVITDLSSVARLPL
jgi:hypothetical protein